MRLLLSPPKDVAADQDEAYPHLSDSLRIRKSHFIVEESANHWENYCTLIRRYKMKEEGPILYPNQKVGERIGAYAKAHSTSVPRHIMDYHDHVKETQPKTANYMISIFQAQAMLFLAKTIGAKRILEIGVYVGVSSLMWSHAVGPSGTVTGLEFDNNFAELAEAAFVKYNVNNIKIVTGDALKTLSTLKPEQPYDIIFIDAQKSGYPQYLKTILDMSQQGIEKRLLRPGGLILGDNILRCGFVADDSQDNPWRNFDFGPHRREYWKSEDIKALRRYNDIIAESDRLETWLCPLWDGINISRLLD